MRGTIDGMTEAIFALLGVVVGSIGTVLGDLLKARRDHNKAKLDTIREICSDFGAAISGMKVATYDFLARGDSPECREQFAIAHRCARSKYEQLRLCSDSLDSQRHARMALHDANGFWRQTIGLPPREGDSGRDLAANADYSLRKLYVEVRKELGLRSPAEVFSDPDKW